MAAVSTVAALDKARCYPADHISASFLFGLALSRHHSSCPRGSASAAICASPLPQRITLAGIGKKGQREDQHYDTMKRV